MVEPMLFIIYLSDKNIFELLELEVVRDGLLEVESAAVDLLGVGTRTCHEDRFSDLKPLKRPS